MRTLSEFILRRSLSRKKAVRILKKAVTLIDIAKACDTSNVTVSKALAGKSGVSDALRAKIKSLKVVYSEEQPIRPIEDMAISCRQNCICPPGTARKCTVRRDIPGSTAFVPSVVGLIVAGEVIKDLAKK